MRVCVFDALALDSQINEIDVVVVIVIVIDIVEGAGCQQTKQTPHQPPRVHQVKIKCCLTSIDLPQT